MLVFAKPFLITTEFLITSNITHQGFPPESVQFTLQRQKGVLQGQVPLGCIALKGYPADLRYPSCTCSWLVLWLLSCCLHLVPSPEPFNCFQSNAFLSTRCDASRMLATSVFKRQSAKKLQPACDWDCCQHCLHSKAKTCMLLAAQLKNLRKAVSSDYREQLDDSFCGYLSIVFA